MLINIGNKETYCFQVDDTGLMSDLSRLKAHYERMETALSNLDAGYSCKVGDADMEYDISEKGFKKFAKDMKSYCDGMIKTTKDVCDTEVKTIRDTCDAEVKTIRDVCDAEIKALKQEISNRDSADTLITEKAKALVQLTLNAQKILNCDSADLADLSEKEIKLKVIAQAYPNLDTANESDEGINAMFKVAQMYQEDSKKKVERHKQGLENVVRQPINYDTNTEMSPREKAKTEAWKLSVGGNR